MLSAALISASEGAPIDMRHLKRCLRRELLKTGHGLDSGQRPALDE